MSKLRMPHPATMFFLLILAVVFLSWICEVYGMGVVLPQTGEEIRVQSLLSSEGIRWMLRNVVANFTGFAPLGLVIVAMFGMGVAEHSGFIEACIRRWVRKQCKPERIVLSVIVLGLLSNVADDAGYIILLPIAAVLFRSVGLPPTAGIITAYVSVACGYSANLFLTTLDPMLATVTQEAADKACIAPSEQAGPLCNYYFLCVSTFLLVFIIYRITCRSLLPRLKRTFDVRSFKEPTKPLSRKEWRALIGALLVGGFYAALVMLATFSSWGILRSVDGSLMHSPFMVGILFLLSFGIGLMGMAYGFASGRYRTDGDVIEGLSQSVKLLGVYFVIAFFASQMFACMEYSHLDRCLAMMGADYLTSCLLNRIGMLVLLILFTAVVNLFMVSATAKWAFLSFVFVPLLAGMGISPDVTQCAFRIGDSATNVLTPFMYYQPLVLTYMLQYDRQSTYASLMRHTWRYSVVILLAWTLLFAVWYLCGLPLGL